MRILIISVALLFGFANTSGNLAYANQAQSPTRENAPSREQIDALIKASCIEQHLNQIPTALKQSARQSGPASAFVQPLMQSLQGVFKPEEMLAILSQDLFNRLDMSTMLDAMAWYNSPNGKKIISAQQSMLKPATMEKVGDALLNQKQLASPERQKLVAQLVKSNQSVEIALDLMVTMQASFMSGLSNMVAPEQSQSFQNLMASFEKSKHLLKPQIEKQILTQQTVVYENLNDETLREFLAFSNSASGQKLFAALNGSLNHTLRTVAQRIPSAMQTSSVQSGTR